MTYLDSLRTAQPATIACNAWSFLGRPDETLACVTQMRAKFAPDTDLALQLAYGAGAAWEAMGNDARRALIPIENKRSFMDVPGDVVEVVDPVFYGDPKTAALKVLGLT